MCLFRIIDIQPLKSILLFMKSFVMNEMSAITIATMKNLEDLFNRIPDKVQLPGDEILSCHILVRVLIKFFQGGLHIVDGWTMNGCEHSWLEDLDGNILDVCPPGMHVSSSGGVLYTHRRFVCSKMYESYEQRQERFAVAMVGSGGKIGDYPDTPKPVFIQGSHFEESVDYLYQLICNSK